MKYNVGQKFIYHGMDCRIKAITDNGKYLIAAQPFDGVPGQYVEWDFKFFEEHCDGFAIMLK